MRLPLVISAVVGVAALSLIQCVGDDPITNGDTTDAGGTSEGGGTNDSSSPVDANGGPTDANAADTSAPVDAPGTDAADAAPQNKQAFVTNGHFMGRLDASGVVGTGGVAAGDARCMGEAATAFPGRTFKAWLATTGATASSRIGTGPWYVGANLLGGITELTTGTLKTTLNLTPTGVVLTTADTVWSGTNGDGTLDTGGDCVDWTSILISDLGQAGTVTGSDTFWTAADEQGCDATRRLYCFEQ
jgi:hypothetical protein